MPTDESPSGGVNVPPLHNAEVQAKIEEKIGTYSYIKVLAKSSVYGRCTDVDASEVCTGDSVRCCASNDRLYKTIRHMPAGRGKVKTNFEKFLISPKGHIIKRFGSLKIYPSQQLLVMTRFCNDFSDCVPSCAVPLGCAT